MHHCVYCVQDRQTILYIQVTVCSLRSAAIHQLMGCGIRHRGEQWLGVWFVKLKVVVVLLSEIVRGT